MKVYCDDCKYPLDAFPVSPYPHCGSPNEFDKVTWTYIEEEPGFKPRKGRRSWKYAVADLPKCSDKNANFDCPDFKRKLFPQLSYWFKTIMDYV